MSEQPLVSILIAAYNSEKYIAEALDSACAQTYSAIEIVVVDDGSTDRTRTIIESYTDPRIRYFFHEHAGIPKTRNKLLREARGDFLAYLDSDDVYLSEKIEEQVHFLQTHPEYAITYCDMLYFFDGDPGHFYKHTYRYYSGEIFKHLLQQMFITNTAILFHRRVLEVAGFYDETMREVEDLPYFLAMAHAGLQFGFLNKKLVKYRLRRDSNTRYEIIDDIAHGALYAMEQVKVRMTAEERVRYAINDIITRKKLLLALAYMGRRKRGRSLSLLRSIQPRKLQDFFLFYALMILSLFPSVFVETALRYVWHKKNERHFVAV